MSTTIRLSERKVREICAMLREWEHECMDISDAVYTDEEREGYNRRAVAVEEMVLFLFRALSAGDHGREIKGQVS